MKDDIMRRIFLIKKGKFDLLTEEEKAIVKRIDLKVSINLLFPTEEDLSLIDKIFHKYF